MTQSKPKGKPPNLTPEQWAEYDQLKATEKLTIRPAAKRQRALKARHDPSANGTETSLPASNPGEPTTALQRIEIAGTPVSTPDTTALQAQIDLLTTQVKDLQAHQLVVDSFISTLQAQSRDAAQGSAELRTTEQRSLAQHSADSAHIWDDPDDAKAVPFNCSLPRGLKRLLDAEAKRTGLPASRLVQRLLMAALTRVEGGHDA
jgi:hypothetical protein